MCAFLRKVNTQGRALLDAGENLDWMLYQVGDELYHLLLEHLKRFTINYAGGMTLVKDLAMYQETIRHFRVAALAERYAFLRELGSIFIVKPEHLKSLLGDGLLGKVEASVLQPFVALRERWSKAQAAGLR